MLTILTLREVSNKKSSVLDHVSTALVKLPSLALDSALAETAPLKLRGAEGKIRCL